jgi:hypothetical protein
VTGCPEAERVLLADQTSHREADLFAELRAEARHWSAER